MKVQLLLHSSEVYLAKCAHFRISGCPHS